MTSFSIGDTGTFKGDPVTFTSMEKRKAGWFIRLTRKGGDTFALSTTQVEKAIEKGELKATT